MGRKRLTPVLFFAALPLGCGGGEPAPAPAAGGGEHRWSEHVVRGKELTKHRNILQQIGLFYQNYVAETGKPPATVEDFKAYIQREGREEVKAIDDGRIIFVPGARTDSVSVLAYEKEPDLNGSQEVVMTDGSVKSVPAGDLKKSLATQPK